MTMTTDNPKSKEHRQLRIQRNLRHQTRQWQLAKQYHLESKPKHYYNKHNALDCGNPQCVVCQNPRRTHKHTLTYQEQSFYQQELWDDTEPTS